MKVEITAEHKAIAKKNGISQAVLWNRVNSRNWDIERAITEEPLSAKGIGERAAELRKSNINNSWYSDGGNPLMCPVEGCGHVGDIITKVHLMNEHGLTREECKKQYGMPTKMRYKEGFTYGRKSKTLI